MGPMEKAAVTNVGIEYGKIDISPMTHFSIASSNRRGAFLGEFDLHLDRTGVLRVILNGKLLGTFHPKESEELISKPKTFQGRKNGDSSRSKNMAERKT